MLSAIVSMFLCLGAGEALSRSGILPLPGQVVGLVIMYAWLLRRGSVPHDLGVLSDKTLSLLGMLFVPAGVGVIAYADAIAAEAVPVAVAVVGGAAVTVLASAKAAEAYERRLATRGMPVAPVGEASDVA